MEAGFLQTSPQFGNIRANVEFVATKLDSKAFKGVALLVLPELFSTGYQFKSKKEAFSLAEEVPRGWTTRRLIEVARKKSIHIVYGIAERNGKNVYNCSVLIGPKGFIGVYRKAHLFSDEKRIFTSGNTPFKVYDIRGAKVGMMICFDWLFPEVARRLSLKGADIIAHPSNLVLPYCPDAMVTRCIENRVFAITANRVGMEERIKGRPLAFIGKSQIVSPKGEILYRAGRRMDFYIVDINPKDARDKKITPKNDIFKDRRVDLY